MRLAYPWMLAALVLPLLVLWRRVRMPKPAMVFSMKVDEDLARRSRRLLDMFCYWLTPAVLVLLVLAASRPQIGRDELSIKTEGVDVVFLMDFSGSMDEPFSSKETKMAAAKRVIREFISRRNHASDRLGLVIFGTDAYTQCPLTLDYDVLVDLLDRAVVTKDFRRATAVGLGLARAVTNLKSSKAKSKVAILVTDGMSNVNESPSGLPMSPADAAELAMTLGVKVYTVGIGQNRDVASLQGNPLAMFFRNRRSDLDAESLKSIAMITGARYFHAGNPQKLSEIYREIDALEKTVIEQKVHKRYKERGPELAALAFAVLMLEQLLRRLVQRSLP